MKNKVTYVIQNLDKNGIITSHEVSDCGIHRSVLQELTASGEYYQAARGIYVREGEWEDEFFLLQQRYQRGIFSHATALYLYGYSDRVPLSFQMTFPKGYNSPSLKHENVLITRVTPENYTLGLSEICTPSGNTVRVYDLERSLCDVLRGKGDDIQIVQAAMKKYALSTDRDINKLMTYAKQLRVEPKVKKYMEVLL